MARAGQITRIGGSSRGAGDDHKSSPKGKHENSAKVARRRATSQAEKELLGEDAPRDPHADYLLPNRQIEIDTEAMEHIGVLLAGVQDFKVLRGSVAVLSLATSVEFAHLLTDASIVGRGEHALVIDLWRVKRSYIFDDEDDEDG